MRTKHQILIKNFQPVMMGLKFIAFALSLFAGSWFCAVLALALPVIPLMNTMFWTANTVPIFALVPEVRVNSITATTTDKTGATTTNIKTLYTAGTNGTKNTRIKAKFTGTSTAGTLLIWVTDTAGANPALMDEVTFSAITSSTTVSTAEAERTYSDLQLKSGQQIWVGATTVNTPIHVTCQIGDF